MACSHIGTRLIFTKLPEGRDGYVCECGARIRFVAGRPTAVDERRPFLMRLAARDYELVPRDDGQIGIRHVACGAISWNRNDVANRYCGRCHLWLEG
jgi:hypothetical protein